MRHPSTAATLLVAVAWLSGQRAAQAWCQMTTEGGEECATSGEPLLWQNRCLSYNLDLRTDQVSAEAFAEAADAAFDTWTGLDCGQGAARFFHAQRSEVPATCKQAEFCQDAGNANVIAFSETWPPAGLADRVDLNPEAQASTLLAFNAETGELLDVDILLNAAEWRFQTCAVANCVGDDFEALDLQNVLAHEVGHLLGLAHPGIAPQDATMFRSQVPGETQKRSLHPDDIAGFCALYATEALTLPCDPTPRNGLDADCESDGACALESAGCRCRTAAGTGPGPLAFGLAAGILWHSLSGRRRRRRSASSSRSAA